MRDTRRMWTRRAGVALAAGVLSLGLAGVLGACAPSAEGDAGQAQEHTTEAEASTRTFTDSCGREVELPADIERIAVSGPIAQQVMLTVAPEKMVGLAGELTEDQATYLGSDYADLPVFGQIYGGKGDFSKEAVAAADPQVVIDIGEAKDTIVEDLDALQEQLGIPCIHIDASSIDTYADMYDELADLLGSERATELADYCRATYDEVASVVDAIPADQRVNAAYLLGDAGTNAMALGGFQSGVIDLVANNVVQVDDPSSSGQGNELSLEQIAVWNPDLIVFAPGSIYDTVADDPAWSEVSAIKNGNYYEVPSLPYNWMSGPATVNQILGLQWFARLVYPDSFDDDMQDVVTEYFELFYQHDLTDEEYQSLMANSLAE